MFLCSLLSATLGAMGSVAAKFAFDRNVLTQTSNTLCHTLALPLPLPQSRCEWLSSWALCLTLLATMLALNSLALTFLLRSMHASSTVRATTVTSSLSFALSGACGWLFFGETLPSQWMLGILIVMGGVALMQSDSDPAATKVKVG